MATVTGTNLLDGVLADLGVTLSATLQAALSARLQSAIDSGNASSIQVAAVLASNPSIAAAVPAGQTPLTTISSTVTTVQTEIEADNSGLPLAVEDLSAAANSVVEGNGVDFTVTMNKAVDADTTFTYQVQGVATSVAAAADPVSDLGVLNGTVTILAGETTGTFTLTPAADGITEGFEAFKVVLLDENNEAAQESGNVLIQDPANAGQSFALTAGVDALTGGAGDDTFNALPALNSSTGAFTLATLNGLDDINGGAGSDTLNATFTSGAPVTVASSVSVQNVETVNLRGDDDLTADTTSWTGTETVNAINVGGDLALTVDSSTTANVTGGKALTSVTGGESVTVTQDTNAAVYNNDTVNDQLASISVDQAKDVTIVANKSEQAVGAASGDNGATPAVNNVQDTDAGISVTNASGAVDITATGSKADGDSITLDNITVTGGTTVNVSQMATSDNTFALTDATAATHTNGDVTITAGDNTTDITVVQEQATARAYQAEVAAVQATRTVKFVDMKDGESVTIDGLTFTASKDLTAAQAAQAFANLSASDRQEDGGIVANGVYTNQSSANWTSGSASSDTVVFTEVAATTGTRPLSVADTIVAGNVSNTTSTAGVSGVAAIEGRLGAAAADVTIEENATASIKNITVDGYNDLEVGRSTDLGALETLTLRNSSATAHMEFTSAVKDLTVTLDNITGDIHLDDSSDSVENLVVNTEGTASTTDISASNLVNLTVNAGVNVDLGTLNGMSTLENVTVTGAGSVDLNSLTNSDAGLDVFDASANTGGVTATISANDANVGDITAYEFSAGNDSVTLSETTVDVDVNLNAGDDKITLATGTTTLAADIDGGAGTDILAMDSDDAATASANATFEGKIANFEKLEVSAVNAADGALVVNLDNMDDISYVIGNGVVAAPSGTTETATVTFQPLTSGQSVTIAGITIAADGADLTAAQVEAAVVAGQTTGNATYSGSLSGWTVADSGTATDGAVTFTSTTANSNVADLTATVNNSVSAPAAPSVSTTDGDAAVPAQTEESVVTFGALTAGQTVTVAGTTLTASAALTANAVAAAFADAANNQSGTGFTLSAASFAGYTVGAASGADLTFTSSALGNVADITVSTGTTATSTTPAIVKADGGAAAAATDTLEFTNMANNGTLELVANGAGGSTKVTMTDAAGTSDVFNIVTTVGSASLDLGEADVAGVETINITATDSNVDEDTDGVTYEAGDRDTATLEVKADAATSIVVDGNSDLVLTLDSETDSLTSINASALEGSLTASTTGVLAMTITGGAGNDTLTVTGSKADTLIGGEGNDTLTAGAGITSMTGGAGLDTFVINTASLNVNSASNITDFASGDVIKLEGATSFTSAATVLDESGNPDLQNYADAAINDLSANEMGWFAYNNNTYIVMDGGSDTSAFVDGQDFIVKISGVVDLDTDATYNATSNTLELV